MTTFGGNTIPPLFIGGGGASFGGYVFDSFQGPIAVGDSSTLNNAQRTVAVNANAGDLLVAFAAAGPGYGGQAGVSIRTPTFQPWSTTGGVIHFDPGVSRFVSHIAPRFATGDSEDDCLIFGIGPFPIYVGVAIFTGSIFGGTLAQITSDNENTQNDNDTGSMFRENGPPGGFAITLKCWQGIKQTNGAGLLATVSNTDQSIIALSLLNVGDNGFGQGMIVANGFKFEELAIDTATGNWPFSDSWTGDVFSMSCTFKSGDS